MTPFLFLMAAVEEPPQIRNEAPGLAAYFSESDYPKAARRWHEEGTVGFKIDIGTDGRVTKCSIIASSGFEDLDKATCRIVIERVRFQPPRDSNGNPLPDSLEQHIRWALPR